MANEAKPVNHEIILLGGRVQQRPQTQGELVIQEISRYQADIAFLSPVGLHPEYGASSFYTEEAQIAQTMVKQSKNTICIDALYFEW